jgi:hypothetical protein
LVIFVPDMGMGEGLERGGENPVHKVNPERRREEVEVLGGDSGKRREGWTSSSPSS